MPKKSLNVLHRSLLLRQRCYRAPDHLKGQLRQVEVLRQLMQHPPAVIAGVHETAFGVRKDEGLQARSSGSPVARTTDRPPVPSADAHVPDSSWSCPKAESPLCTRSRIRTFSIPRGRSISNEERTVRWDAGHSSCPVPAEDDPARRGARAHSLAVPTNRRLGSRTSQRPVQIIASQKVSEACVQ